MTSLITYYPKVIIVWHLLKKTYDGKLLNTQTKLNERFVKIWLHFMFFWVKSHQKGNKGFEPMTKTIGKLRKQTKGFHLMFQLPCEIITTIQVTLTLIHHLPSQGHILFANVTTIVNKFFTIIASIVKQCNER
jgi:hypothetical protein